MNDQSEATVYKPPKRSLRQPARRVSHRFRAIDIRLSARLSPDCFPIPFNALVDRFRSMRWLIKGCAAIMSGCFTSDRKPSKEVPRVERKVR
jgi:hypothetical protein